MRISQREARRMRKRLADLERAEESRLCVWASEWPGGVHIGSVRIGGDHAPAIRTARKLKHAVVCTVRDDGEVLFYALPLGRRT